MKCGRGTGGQTLYKAPFPTPTQTLSPTSIEDLAVCVVFNGLLSFVMASRMPSRKNFPSCFQAQQLFLCFSYCLFYSLSLSLLSIGSSAHFPFICFLLVLCLSFGKVDATSRTTQGHFKTEATDDRAEFDRQTEKERKKERGRVRQMESGG